MKLPALVKLMSTPGMDAKVVKAVRVEVGNIVKAETTAIALEGDVAKLAAQKIATELGVTLDEVKTVARNVLSESNATSSIDDFWKVVKSKVWKTKADKIIGKLVYGKISIIEKNGGMQYINRGWTKTDIENIIRSPKKIGKSINNHNGVNNPATVFYNSNYEHIVVDDVTGEIVQIADKLDKNWIPDGRIYNLIDF